MRFRRFERHSESVAFVQVDDRLTEVSESCRGDASAWRLWDYLSKNELPPNDCLFADETPEKSWVPLSPIPPGGQILCTAFNFALHSSEASVELGKFGNDPKMYLKPSYTMVPSGSTVRLPYPGCKVTWEAELAIIFGNEIYGAIDDEEALNSIAGCTVVNDLGDHQLMLESSGEWIKGKGFDAFTVSGESAMLNYNPDFVSSRRIRAYVNGKLKQEARLDEMLLDPVDLVVKASQFFHFYPGDMLFCGTPGGTALDSGVYLSSGDHVSVEIEDVSVADCFMV